MCLDPRPDRPYRLTRSARSLSASRPRAHRSAAPASDHAVVRASALRALEHLAGEDELVARGWVVLSRSDA
jgi:hypothetical protein